MKYALLLVVAAGCSSLVSDPCASGFDLVDGTCTNTGSGSGSGLPPKLNEIVSGPVVPIDPLVCALPTVECHGVCKDLSSDPENCGHCGRVCSSGICMSSTCVGDLPGHIIAIGHDYATADPAMDKLLANAVAANSGTDVRIGWWQGTATEAGAIAAAQRGLAQTGRSSADTMLTAIDGPQLVEIDTVVIEPQIGDGNAAEASGNQSAAALAAFLASGHVVVVLETTDGVSYRYAAGASLFTVAAPVDATNSPVTVAIPGDVVAVGVVSPYLARRSSIGYPGVAQPVVVDGANDAVVFHTVY